MNRNVPAASLSAVVIAAVFCIGCQSKVSEKPIGAPIAVKIPLGLPPLPVPADNPVTAETVALGRKLFYEKKLSGDNTISCSMCHNPQVGFTDGRKHSTGMGGKTGTRNAPTVLNAAYGTAQFWDGRAASLELQAAGPIANPVEMNQPHDVSVAKLSADPKYTAMFDAAFGPGPITIGKVEKSIASFERTMLSGDSPFDRYKYGGDKTTLSPAAIRGLAIFTGKNKGNCAACHSIGEKYALFTDGKYHDIGVGVDGEGAITDPGRFSESKLEAERGAFKTPSLRNVGESAPYMHDGSLRTLKDVVDFYAGGGNSNPNLDKEIKPRKLSGQDREDLIEFLESLNGETPADAGPPKT
jgi:cytochrome c peroxidase